MSPIESGLQCANRRFLALGDSYTIGEGVPAAARWPDGLARALLADGIVIDAPQIVARTGWTTDELASAMAAATFAPPYVLATLMIGVNNQYRGRDVTNYRTEFRTLLQRAIGLAGQKADHVLVVSIPDWGVTRFAREHGCAGAPVADAIDAFNAAAREEADGAGARWVDITDISRRCGAQADMLAADGLHPSAAQYALWARRIVPVARGVLRAHAEDAGVGVAETHPLPCPPLEGEGAKAGPPLEGEGAKAGPPLEGEGADP